MDDRTKEKEISRFIDLLNKYGFNSQDVQDFIYQYKNITYDKEMLELIDVTLLLKGMFDNNEL